MIVDAVTGRIVEANPFLLDLLEYSAEEITAKTLWDIGLVENVDAGQESFRDLIEKEYVRYENLPLRTRQGGTRQVEFISNVYSVGSERVVQCLIRDITERKQVEDQLRIFTAQLEQSNRELENFAYVASHDLQEPLRKIQAFGERLTATCSETLSPEGADYVDRMQKSAARMQTLINDLLAFSRVRAHDHPFAEVQLSSIVDDVLSDLQPVIQKSGATVDVEQLPAVTGNDILIRQLFQNVIGNALKFHRAGEIPHVKIYAEEPDEAASQVGAGGQCRIVVRDNGIGFDEKYLDRIFAIFQRLHGRNEYEGTGIGLAICRRIAEHHGGEITASSTPGQGATFVISLPRSTEGIPSDEYSN